MSQELAAILGIKKAPLIAGFIGAILSLYFIKNLTRTKAAVAVIGGAACAAYLTPWIIVWFGLRGSEEAESAAAFLIGILGMNIIGGVFFIGEQFKNNPIEFFTKIFKRKA